MRFVRRDATRRCVIPRLSQATAKRMSYCDA
jgi:hypothetical protein